MFQRILLFILCCALWGCQQKSPEQKKYKIGLCTVATGRYDIFAREMIESARPFFCKNHEVTYFVFTDGHIPEAKDVVVVYQEHQGWPFATLKRFHIYDKNRKVFADMDYLFAIDADMRFAAPVGDEILGKTVGVSRDVGKHLTYEGKKRSRAYVKKKKAKHYFAGAFYGGTRSEFLKLVHKLKKRVDLDLKENYIAIWHDESHLNRYFFDHPPEVCLNTSYCYFENWDLPYEQKIIAMDKSLREVCIQK